MDRNIEQVWKYFEIHAQQRMTLFNFYIVIVLAVSGAICLLIKEMNKLSYFTAVMSLLLTLVSFLFWKLDQRTSYLIKRAEQIIAEIDLNDRIFKKQDYLLAQENKTTSNFKRIWTYGKVFRWSFSLVGIIGLVIFLLSFVVEVFN